MDNELSAFIAHLSAVVSEPPPDVPPGQDEYPGVDYPK